jgi:hypothetical protein
MARMSLKTALLLVAVVAVATTIAAIEWSRWVEILSGGIRGQD